MSASLLAEIEKGTKNALVKKRIIAFHMEHGAATITDLTKVLGLSVPTVSKLVDELTETGLIIGGGKLETNGGRNPSLYRLNPVSCYFVGVDIKKNAVSLGLMDFGGGIVDKRLNVPYDFDNNMASLERLCEIINSFLDAQSVPRSQILNMNVNISGRVNPVSGYSYSLFNFDEKPLSDVLSEKTGVRVCIENDTRAMTYGEYAYGENGNVMNMLFVNLSLGLGLGAIIDGNICTGKSGFAGELGHMVTYDNEVICHCGKKGCLETEASGSALVRKLTARLDEGANSIIADRYLSSGSITLDDVLEAIEREDLLCIELVEEVGRELGRWLAGLINIFNPEKVVIGGMLSSTGDYILQPIRMAVRRYSLNLVNKDTKIVLSEFGERAGLIGACFIARRRAFDDYLENAAFSSKYLASTDARHTRRNNI